MAEAYARKRFREEKLDIEVRSAGTLSLPGLEPTKEAIKVLSIEKIPVNDLSSKGITEEMIDWADMIFVMEPEHKLKLLEMAPGIQEKIRLLGEINTAPGNFIIPDPIGRSLSFYRASFRMIREPLEELISWLKK